MTQPMTKASGLYSSMLSRLYKSGLLILAALILALLIFRTPGKTNTDQWQTEMLEHSLQALHFFSQEGLEAFDILAPGEFDDNQWQQARQRIQAMRKHLLGPGLSVFAHPVVANALDPELAPLLELAVFDLPGSMQYWELWYPNDLDLEYTRWPLSRTAEATLPVLERMNEITAILAGMEAEEFLVLVAKQDRQIMTLLGELLEQLTELGPALLSECST